MKKKKIRSMQQAKKVEDEKREKSNKNVGMMNIIMIVMKMCMAFRNE